MAVQILLHTSTVAIPWQLTHLLHSRNYSKTRPLTLNSVKFFSIFGRLFLYYSFILILFSSLMDYKNIYTINIEYQYTRQFNEAQRGEISINWQTTKDNHKCSDETIIAFTESSFETLEQHDDHAHSDETSHEKLMQPKQTQNSGPLLKTVLGD